MENPIPFSHSSGYGTRSRSARNSGALAIQVFNTVYEQLTLSLPEKVNLLRVSTKIMPQVPRSNFALSSVFHEGGLLIPAAFDHYVFTRVDEEGLDGCRHLLRELPQVLDSNTPKVISSDACRRIDQAIKLTRTKKILPTALCNLLANSRCYDAIRIHSGWFENYLRSNNLLTSWRGSDTSVININFQDVYNFKHTCVGTDAFFLTISEQVIKDMNENPDNILPRLLAYCRVVPYFIRPQYVDDQRNKDFILAVMKPFNALRCLCGQHTPDFSRFLVNSTIAVFDKCPAAVTQPDIDWLAQTMNINSDLYCYSLFQVDRLFTGNFIARTDINLDPLLTPLGKIVELNAIPAQSSFLLSHCTMNIIVKTKLLNTHLNLINHLACYRGDCDECLLKRLMAKAIIEARLDPKPV